MKLFIPLTLVLLSSTLIAKDKINCSDFDNIPRKHLDSCIEKSDKALNKVYKYLINSHKGQAEPQEMLKKAQRAWLVTRENHCTLIGRELVVSAGIGMATCELKMTQHRTKELQELFDLGVEDPEPLTITKDSFMHIKIGSKISDHKAYTKKATLKTGEGDFSVFNIFDSENHKVGYFLPNSKNAKLVGDIFITSSRGVTSKGSAYVGMNFGTLKKIFPKLTVHGSEIEGNTHAVANGIMYRLDANNVEYNIKMKKIPNKTKIIEIILQKR